MKTEQELLQTWEYNTITPEDHKTQKYRYTQHSTTKDLLLYCKDIDKFINISDPNDCMAYATYDITKNKVWETPRTPQEELEAQ